jgi:uncharacterized DUF497 family protein
MPRARRSRWKARSTTESVEPIGAHAFEQASTLFTGGEDYLEIFDEAHADDKDRFIAIGPVAVGLVFVVYTEWDEETVRIISARWATKPEAERYRSHMMSLIRSGGQGEVVIYIVVVVVVDRGAWSWMISSLAGCGWMGVWGKDSQTVDELFIVRPLPS